VLWALVGKIIMNMVPFQKFLCSKILRVYITELKTANIIKIGSSGEELYAPEVQYSQWSKLGQNNKN
jgi:hypothetical protein